MHTHSLKLVAVLSVFQLGCATIFGPKEVSMPISSVPSGAQVYVDGVDLGVTPTKLQLDIRRSYTLVLKKEGDPDQPYYLRNYVGAGWVILDIFLLVPLIVDAGTQEWNYYAEDSINVCFPSEVAAEKAALKASQADMAATKAKIPACNMSGTEAWKSASPEQKKNWIEECNKAGKSAAYLCLASAQPSH